MTTRRPSHGTLATLVSLGLAAHGCLDRPVSSPDTRLVSGVVFSFQPRAVDRVDILFGVDDSTSMRENQLTLARQFDVLISQLVSPPVDPATRRPRYPAVKSLHVGVVSSDLGTPGSVVPSCANSDVGDDGMLNPIRRGLALRTHQPWSTLGPEVRPARCTMDPNQYPLWLEFDANAAARDPNYAAGFREDFVCNAVLSYSGCGLEQQLESVYRALVVHDAREAPGNMSPNAGFVRDDALLAVVMVTDEEDGSTRDCRYAESGQPCTDATGVFDSTSSAWSSTDLNLRFYMYQPGSAQDPTWPIDRYMDPTHPQRGFTSLKPGRPQDVIFAAIAGVPNEVPLRAGSTDPNNVDWDALLDTQTTSREGPISMRQAQADPACPNHVVPACRREGTTYDPARPTCDAARQYFAWPSRRVVQVARRFAETYDNGAVSSICHASYEGALQQIVTRIQSRLPGRCLPRALETTPRVCGVAGESGCVAPDVARAMPLSVNCRVREVLPPDVDPAAWCTAAHGRTRAGVDAGRAVCLVTEVPAPYQGPAPTGSHGFYYDTTVDPEAPSCHQRISFTDGDAVPNGATTTVECVQDPGVR